MEVVMTASKKEIGCLPSLRRRLEKRFMAMIDHDRSKQVTRGYNIVAAGWAGASNPYSYPNPNLNPNNHKHLERSFFHFLTQSPWTDQQMDNRPTCCNGSTDGRTKPLIESLVRD